jgi:predicted Rossmann-fold nucleotide-binding protein
MRVNDIRRGYGPIRRSAAQSGAKPASRRPSTLPAMLPDIEPRDLPVNPFRSSLYTPEELLGGFDGHDPGSYERTIDFDTYRIFVQSGRLRRVPYMHSIVQAIHDNSMTQALNRFVDGRRMVGVMGGHRMRRDSPVYRQIVELSKRLAELGYTMVSGGGPGAMEATHLGAHLAGHTAAEVETALATIGETVGLPDDLGDIVTPDGSIDESVIDELHAWQAPAFAVARAHPPGAESLAIPTWHFGHEPPTPLASHLAKYFQNSIREDGLLAIATWGVIFAEGLAGTLQEIFQDANQNFYRSFEWFSPMVLLGVDYWTTVFPVLDVLRALFEDPDEDFLTITDDLDVAVAAIGGFEPPTDGRPR